MTDHLFPTLAELDRDGAIAEAASRVDGHTRAAFMGKVAALVGGTAAAGSLALPALASAASKGDVAILNYALTLEYLEAAFYKSANDKGALSGEAKKLAKVVGEHEAQHVVALKKALGSAAVKTPSFDFKGTTADQATFLKTSMTLEDAGVKAYLGQAGAIKSKDILSAAASILSVEARHAAWVANVLKVSPAPESFQSSASMDQILAAVKGTGFIPALASASPSSATSGAPSVTG
jgi:rubrerythrin